MLDEQKETNSIYLTSFASLLMSFTVTFDQFNVSLLNKILLTTPIPITSFQLNGAKYVQWNWCNDNIIVYQLKSFTETF